jgi:GNAT superfamily N-acetyltransferase
MSRYVQSLKSIFSSPVWDLIPYAKVELNECGYNIRQDWPISTDSSCLIAYEQGEIAGFLVYSTVKEAKYYWINLSYTLPKFRRSGVNTLLFNALVKKAEENNIISIRSGTHVKNKEMRNVMEKQGREPVCIEYHYTLSNYGESEDGENNQSV